MSAVAVLGLLIAMLVVAPSASATAPVVQVSPHRLNFGTVPPFKDEKTFTLTNVGTEAVFFRIDDPVGYPGIHLGDNWDYGSSCIGAEGGWLLEPGETCSWWFRYGLTNPDFGVRDEQVLTVTVFDPDTGEVLDTQTVTLVARIAAKAPYPCC